jgi:hypothetical protein
MLTMTDVAQATTITPAEVVRQTPVSQAANGVCYAVMSNTTIPTTDVERMVAAVPAPIAASLTRKAYYFVPLTIGQGDDTLIADRYDVALSDQAVCHRNLNLGDSQYVFISSRLMDDKFSLAFEFFINVAHAFVERAGVPETFSDLVWKQVEERLRGETGLDAWEFRKAATSNVGDTERAKNEYFAASFADSIAIYMLSTFTDVDYYDLREREYPLLAPNALGERLRKIADMFPPNSGFEFNIFYRRR